MELKLANIDQEISSIEVYLEQRRYGLQEIEKLDELLKQGQDAFMTPSSYNSTLRRYNDLVDHYNIEADATNQMIEQYEQLIELYNAKVDEYNELAESAYSRWYLVPLPRGSGKALSRKAPLH